MTDNRTTDPRKKRGWSAKTASMMEGLVDDGQDNRATDLLCKMLDERGEDYTRDDFSVTWSYYSDPHTATESMDGTLIVTGLTPDQAIAATLENGTCEWVLEHSGTLYDKWRCSKCGYLFVESRTDQGIKEDFVPNYCPHCGKAVKR